MPIDYTSFDGSGASKPQLSKRWWTLKGVEKAQAIIAVVTSLSQADSRRQTQLQTSARLYGNLTLMGVNGLSYSRVTSAQTPLRDRISYNVCQSCVDTVTSKIGKNKPKPLFLTSGGDWKLQKRAKKLDKCVDGIFYENDAHRLGVEIFRDAAVSGDGVIHVYDRHGRAKFERVLSSELYVDELEAFYGNPRQMHRVKNVDRAVLQDLFPGKKELILAADSATSDLTGQSRDVADQVTVVESWHLPSGPDATDGDHVICVPGGILFEEKWKKDYFPFAFFRWSKRLFGFWGQGLVEQVQNIQLEINKLLWIIQRSMHMAGTFKVLMENGSKIVKEHISNDVGAIVMYSGSPPQYVTPPIVPPEIYQHLQTLKNLAYEQAGISQLSASSQKPAGLNSGKAMREYNDIETDRFQTVGQAYEQLFLDLADLAIDVVKDIFAKEKSYSVNIPGKKFLETIDWKEIKLGDDEYVMKVYPISSLPTDPAGRLDTITDYMQAGMMTPRVGRRLLDFPDLEAQENLANSQEDWLHEVIEKMIEDGDVYHPEPEDDLELAHELSLEYIAYAKTCGVDDEKIQVVRDFLKEVISMKTPPMPPPGPAMGADPLAAPMAPPTSDLLPTAPGAAA